MMLGEGPSLNNLRPIGMQCFYLVPGNMAKFAEKGKEGIFIGYEDGSKAYRIWDPVDRKIVISGNVMFNKYTDLSRNSSSSTINALGTNSENPNPATPQPPPQHSTTSITPTELFTSITPTSRQLVTPISRQLDFLSNTDSDSDNENDVAENVIEPSDPSELSSNDEVDTADTDLSVPNASSDISTISARPSRSAKSNAMTKIVNLQSALSGITEYFDPFTSNSDVLSTNEFALLTNGINEQHDELAKHFELEKFQQTSIESFSHSAPEIFNALLATTEEDGDPDHPSLQQALNGDDKELWKIGIDKELDTLWKTGTWVAVNRSSIPSDVRPISSKFHLRIKRDPVRNTTQHKARFVCRGFSQVAGIDYHETFSPVANFRSIQILLTIGIHMDYEIHQLDFDAAFLNADIKEEVYVEPIGTIDPRLEKEHVYKLKKTLYGLKQSPREWWLLLKSTLDELGWYQLLSDQCVFFRDSPSGREFVTVYVDDLIVVSPSMKQIEATKLELSNKFKSKDLGELTYILGVRITRDRQRKILKLDQESLIEKYIEHFEVKGTAPTPGFWKEPRDGLIQNSIVLDTHQVQSRVGTLLYIALHTRPDILFEVNKISRNTQCMSLVDYACLSRIFCYLNGSKGLSLVLDGNADLEIKTFTDADWAGDKRDRKSISGMISFIGNSPVCWSSKKQQCISLSTMESELVATTAGCQDSLWIEKVLTELCPPRRHPIKIFCDNLPAIKFSSSLANKSNARHISLKYLFIKGLSQSNRITLEHVKGLENPADIFTKSLGPNQYNNILRLISLFA